MRGIRVGYGANGNGTMLMTGGEITFDAENGWFGLLDVGSGPNAVGRMEQSGGTITTPYAFQVGANGGQGTYVLSGDGILDLQDGATTYIGLTEDDYKGSVENSVGLLHITGNGQYTNHGGQVFVGLGGEGTITQDGPGSRADFLVHSFNFVFGANGGAGIYNLVDGEVVFDSFFDRPVEFGTIALKRPRFRALDAVRLSAQRHHRH